LKPIVYDGKYEGLQSVPKALQALGSRKTWGKVVIDVKSDAEKARL
jgi:NADPH:quinone reductase